MVDVIDLLRSRRSVRAYEDRPVAPDLLRQLLVAAMAAPSACNSQPWEFVVVTQPETLEHLRAKLLFARYNAPAAIAVCANLRIAHSSAAQHYWVQDCSAATENILIAATGLGLGAVWIGVYPLPSVMAPVRQILGLPEDVTPLSLVYVGYPAEQNPPNDGEGHGRYEERRVYWEQYEPRKRRARKKNAKYE
jgi:nitroreductase